jgi:hypothetical protein
VETSYTIADQAKAASEKAQATAKYLDSSALSFQQAQYTAVGTGLTLAYQLMVDYAATTVEPGVAEARAAEQWTAAETALRRLWRWLIQALSGNRWALLRAALFGTVQGGGVDLAAQLWQIEVNHDRQSVDRDSVIAEAVTGTDNAIIGLTGSTLTKRLMRSPDPSMGWLNRMLARDMHPVAANAIGQAWGGGLLGFASGLYTWINLRRSGIGGPATTDIVMGAINGFGPGLIGAGVHFVRLTELQNPLEQVFPPSGDLEQSLLETPDEFSRATPIDVSLMDSPISERSAEDDIQTPEQPGDVIVRHAVDEDRKQVFAITKKQLGSNDTLPVDRAFAENRLYVAEGRIGKRADAIVGYFQIRDLGESGVAIGEEMVIHPKADPATARSVLDGALEQASLDGYHRVEFTAPPLDIPPETGIRLLGTRTGLTGASESLYGWDLANAAHLDVQIDPGVLADNLDAMRAGTPLLIAGVGGDTRPPSVFASVAPETPAAFTAKLGQADIASGAEGLMGWTEEQVRIYRAVAPDAAVVYAGGEDDPDYAWMIENGVAIGVGSVRELSAAQTAAEELGATASAGASAPSPRYAVRARNIDLTSTATTSDDPESRLRRFSAEDGYSLGVPEDLLHALEEAGITPDFAVVNDFMSVDQDIGNRYLYRQNALREIFGPETQMILHTDGLEMSYGLLYADASLIDYVGDGDRVLRVGRTQHAVRVDARPFAAATSRDPEGGSTSKFVIPVGDMPGALKSLKDQLYSMGSVVIDGRPYRVSWSADGNTLYLDARSPDPVPATTPNVTSVRLFGHG